MPAWFDLLVQWGALGIVAVGLVGLPLLLVGLFEPYLVLPGAVVVWLVLVQLRRVGRPRPAPVSRTTHLISVAAVALAVVDVVVNARQATQHLLVDGDPAVYGMTAKWISLHGTLDIPIHPEWLGNDSTVNYMTNGFFLRPDGHHLYPQFFHLLPVLLGIGNWFAGTAGLLHLTMLIGGFALLAVFAFASRLMHPAWALAATTTLALTLPQIFFTRDTFSEIPSEYLVWAGLALLCDATTRRCRRPGGVGLLAGLTLGASTMTRIDAFAYIPPLIAAVAALALCAPRASARRATLARVVVGLSVGLVVTAAVGAADAAFGSPAYATSVRGELTAIGAGTVIVAVAAFVTMRHPRAEQFAVRVGHRLARLAPALGTILAVVFGLFWLVRPLVQTAHETGVLDMRSMIANLQRSEHVAVDPTRHYNEMSLRWISWYVGPITLSLAIIGLGYLTYRVLRGRDHVALPFLLVAGAVTAGYVYDPLITPVQYWATRHYVPVTFPALFILAFLVLARVFSAAWGASELGGATSRLRWPAASRLRWPAASRLRWRAASRLRWPMAALACGLGAVVLATPIVLLQGPVRLVHSYVLVRDAVHRLCGALQPSDVVLLVGYNAQTNDFVQTIETYCGNMAAISGPKTEPADISRMAAAAAASGHRLVLVSSQQKPVDSAGRPLGVTLDTVVTNIVFDTEALSLTHRPDSDFKVALPIYLAPAAS